jgi:alpha-tubulin suppressor-like RCC1 family protein
MGKIIIINKGMNSGGQLGIGSNTNQRFATFVPLFNIKKLVTGFSYTIAISNDNTIYGWGENQVIYLIIK